MNTNQQPQGKISIQQGKKSGEELVWGNVIAEKEYQYFGEATEALEAFTWEEAEEVCKQKLDDSFAILFKLIRTGENNSSESVQERVLLYFVDKEKESLGRK